MNEKKIAKRDKFQAKHIAWLVSFFLIYNIGLWLLFLSYLKNKKQKKNTFYSSLFILFSITCLYFRSSLILLGTIPWTHHMRLSGFKFILVYYYQSQNLMGEVSSIWMFEHRFIDLVYIGGTLGITVIIIESELVNWVNSWTRLFAFHINLIWIQLFSLQLWIK